jgi:hypothetical protein
MAASISLDVFLNAGGPAGPPAFSLADDRRCQAMPQFGTQRLTAAPRSVRNAVRKLCVLGAQAVDNTICWGEQTGKLQ